jgi:hypothetical protein
MFQVGNIYRVRGASTVHIYIGYAHMGERDHNVAWLGYDDGHLYTLPGYYPLYQERTWICEGSALPAGASRIVDAAVLPGHYVRRVGADRLIRKFLLHKIRDAAF